MNQSQNPKVSVIISTYNRANLLPRAVNSVLSQTYDDYEVIIVDDASSDDTQKVVAVLNDPRIRSLRHDRNLGHSASINTGISHAKGEYIAFLDDDDEWLPNKLEGQVRLLDSSPQNVGLVYGWMDRIEETTGRVIGSYRTITEGNLFEDSLALNIPGPFIVLLVRSSVVREVKGMDESLSRYDDADLICRISQHYHMAVLPEVVAIAYSEHEREQIGDDNSTNLAEAASFLRNHMDRFTSELDERPQTLGILLRRLAKVEMMRGNRSVAVSALMSALRLDPLGVSKAILKNHRLAVKLLVRLVLKPRSVQYRG